VRPGTVRRIWPYLRPYRGAMVLLLGITAVDSAILVVSPLILRLIIDDGILRHRESVVVALALTVAGLALVDAGARYVKSWYSQWIGESLVLELRASVFRHVQRQSLAFFTRTQTGSLVSRMDDDIGETQRLVGVLMSESVSVPLNLVLVLAAMFWLSWQLSLVALAVIPLFVLPGKVAARRVQRLFRQQMQLHGELATMMAERSDVSGALLAKLYGRPEEEARLFTRKATRIRDLAVANAAGMQLVLSFITLLAALVTALVYGLGGTLVIHGVFQVGTLVAFIALVTELYGPLSDASSLPLEILTALVSFDRVFEILDLEPLITERPAAHPLTQTPEAPGVAVEGVWFRYPEASEVSLASLESVALPAPECPGDAWVLRDVTFRVPAGKLTALVGPSGAGKTTITHLVPRLYDPVHGTVRIGGHDIRDLTLESMRSVVGVVPQDAYLFHDTIRANLTYARPSATEKELIEACQAARIWELISSLPDGLDTIAGDRGYRFSGGQKQRLALARLLLKAPSVVVLDEATAHLDSESEVAIQRALATALAGRTSLVIAHRLSTVRAADQILVVDGGQIAERGTHNELLAAGGTYAGLYRTQFAPQAA
jgi:ATP-binding cassette, subfamily B, bacterial